MPESIFLTCSHSHCRCHVTLLPAPLSQPPITYHRAQNVYGFARHHIYRSANPASLCPSTIAISSRCLRIIFILVVAQPF
ncbi:hypothetical protein SLA2020_397620 [Shorea laevis]